MKTTSIIAAILLGLASASWAQSTVVYFDGPAFAFPSDYSVVNLDIDHDGVADFSVSCGPYISTDGIGGATAPYFISSLSSNSILCRGGNAVVFPSGALIGSTNASNGVWTTTDGATVVTAFFTTGGTIFTSEGIVVIPSSSGWGGPLSGLGEGYLGVRFQAADGTHYGWIRARLPGSSAFEGAPLIVDWAYESRPDTVIAAGALPIAPLAAPQIIRPQNLRLSWQSQIDQPYQVQFKDRIDAADWTNLDFTVIATATTSAVDVPITDSTRFYRVIGIK